MPDVTRELNRMIERMREQLDGEGVELTRDHLRAAALAALSALTEEGMILESGGAEARVRNAVQIFRGGGEAPPEWDPHRWVNAVNVQLGQAARAAGLILEAEDADFHRALFAEHMIGVAATAQEAIVSRERADAR